MSSFKSYNLARALADHFEHSRPPAYNGFAAKVSQVLSTRMSSGAISGEEVATALGIELKQLHCHLHEQGTNFDDVLERLRRRAALCMLMHQQKPSIEIYSALGFASVDSLSQAFKRWTGLAPDIFFRLYREHIAAAGIDSKDCDCWMLADVD